MTMDAGIDMSPAKAALLHRWRAGAWQASAPQLERRADHVGALPTASRFQQRYWRIRDTESDRSSRCIGFFGRFDLPVDHAAFAEAVRQIGLRQGVLRTSLDERDGLVVQVVHDEPLVESALVDLTHAGDEAPTLALDDARREIARPFDLRRGPLGVVKLYRLSTTGYAVTVVIHHACADGWSLGVAVRELDAFYTALTSGRPVDLAPLPVSYVDFAAWQADWERSDECRRYGEHWRSKLSGWRAARIPADAAATGVAGLSDHLDVTLPDDLVVRVRALASALQMPVFAVLLSAFTLVLAERADGTDIGIYLGTANRDRPETHPLVGLFATAVTLPLPIDHRSAFADLASRAHRDVMVATARQDFDQQLYLARVEPGRDLAEMPLTTGCVGFQPPLPTLRFGGAVLVPYELPTASANHNDQVSLHLYNDAFGIRGRLQYAPAVTSTTTAEAMCRRFEQLTARAVDDPSQALAAMVGAA
jgi:hypothetical protein